MLEDEWIYVVEEGDTVDEIAAKTGRPVGELIWANQLNIPTAWQWASLFMWGQKAV